MLFLTRTAICIGLVAFAASNASGGGLATALDRSARDAAETAGRACLGSGDCLRIGATMLAAAAPDPAPATRSHRRSGSSARMAALPSPVSPRVAASPRTGRTSRL